MALKDAVLDIAREMGIRAQCPHEGLCECSEVLLRFARELRLAVKAVEGVENTPCPKKE